MKEVIKKIYKDKMIDNVKQFNFNDYYYFIDDNSNIFGILKSNITHNEKELILANFSMFKDNDFYDESFKILEFLLGKSNEEVSIKNLKYYLIKFYNLTDVELQLELSNLLKASFEEAYVLMKNNLFIILSNKDLEIDFESILKSIESDFLIKLIGYESDFYEVTDSLPNYFQIDYYSLVNYNNTNNLLLSKVNLLINNILLNIDDTNKQIIKSYILKEFVSDQEMISVIKMYFETNFNTTLAAKNCYMHRNTFLNKLDKFMQNTNYNLRNYADAFIVYLAIIM
ncbi:MAG: hypothetical protein K0Q49_1538 [Haloplasmataceae bacterium]|nr:hypothetical protein [Haloplasmataceae bacterium]